MGRTAKEAGWHKSRYNIGAMAPDGSSYIMVNLLKGTCACYSIAEMFLYDEAESLDEDHPILKRFAERGLIADYDEQALLETMSRAGCGFPSPVTLTICPTMGCNFDCPYCFENHQGGKMTEKVQDDIVRLVGRLMESSRSGYLKVNWFGGEPLLAPEIIESLSERLMNIAEQYNADYSASIVTNGYLLTQPIADMLGRCKVKKAQVTLDGIGKEHDKTRHLANKGPTFDKITDNLRTLHLPFRVNIRHNVHLDNRDQVQPLQKLVKEIAQESGNIIEYYSGFVFENKAADQRGSDVRLLCGDEFGDVGASEFARKFRSGSGSYCGANRMYNLGISVKGELHKCWEDVDRPEHSFGTAEKWDPMKPFETADRLDNLSCYINCSMPLKDPECLECIWLPICVGGCPTKRLFYTRACIPVKDEPEKYVLALYQRLEQQRRAFADTSEKQ